jgi:Flp pilus assembly protein TadD
LNAVSCARLGGDLRAPPRLVLPATRRALCSGALAVCLLVSACHPQPPGVLTGPQLTRALHARSLDPATLVVPYELNAAMQQWAHRVVPRNTPVEKRLDLLLAAVLAPDGLALAYAPGFTGTAREVFESRHANCLGFTNLFVGLAREMDVPAFYLDVDDVERFSKEGDLVIEAGHVTGGFGNGTQLRVLDFAAAPIAHYRKVRELADLSAIALYYSNRGAELLRAGHPPEALDWLRTAVRLDPNFSRGWINLGVALRRTGDLKGAEAAYGRAIELEPGVASAYANLAALLRASGRTEEGDRVLALTSHLSGRDPFSYLILGDLSLARGHLEEARRYYQRAHRLDRNAETCAALGEIELASGGVRAARRWLEKARKIDPQNDRVRRLEKGLGGQASS